MQIVVRVATSIAIGIIAYIAVKILFDKLILKKRNDITLKFLRSILQVVVIALSLFFFLSQFSNTKDLATNLLKGSTLIIAILTFAAQKTLGNMISGFSIAIAHPFEVGQKIRVINGSDILAEGYIKDITVRHTVVQQYDGQSCIVPNSVMDESVIVNTNYDDDIGNRYTKSTRDLQRDHKRADTVHKKRKHQHLCVKIYRKRFDVKNNNLD